MDNINLIKFPLDFITPAIFHRYINCIFRDLNRQNIVCIDRDDIIILARDDEKAMERLQLVLETSSVYG